MQKKKKKKEKKKKKGKKKKEMALLHLPNCLLTEVKLTATV